MNSIDNAKGIVGAATTGAGLVLGHLPIINEAVQLVAGVVAIVVGVMTIRHYWKIDRKK
ncbi:MAG: hypothetical protein ABSE16_01580 [Verrucomicrobiota bacterium]|jgi:hypothetical protein